MTDKTQNSSLYGEFRSPTKRLLDAVDRLLQAADTVKCEEMDKPVWKRKHLDYYRGEINGILEVRCLIEQMEKDNV